MPQKLDDFIPRNFSLEGLSARWDMIMLIRHLCQMGLFTATYGTNSVRLSDDSFLITPFAQDRAYMLEEDLVRVKAGRKEIDRMPSRAALLHKEIYRRNPEIRAMLQAHPVHAMCFAMSGAEFDPLEIHR